MESDKPKCGCAKKADWSPSNLNLSAQGQLVAEDRVEGSKWSPSSLNLKESQECTCLPGDPELETSNKYGSPEDLEATLAHIKEAPVAKRSSEELVQKSQITTSTLGEKSVCQCKKTLTKEGKSDTLPDSDLPDSEDPKENMTRRKTPIEAIQIVPAPMGKKLFALEDVYVWESKSYAGSEESNKLEEQRRKGLAPIPLGPGERSDEELGVAPIRPEKPTVPSDATQITGSASVDKVKCSCKVLDSEESKEDTSEIPASSTGEGPEVIPETATRRKSTIEAIQVVPAPMGKKLFALEDVYVWESKSYAGSEESNKLEEQRRKGLAPIPLGPGERSDEELGIAPIRPEELTVPSDATQITGSPPVDKVKCSCKVLDSEESKEDTSEIPASSTGEGPEVVPETATRRKSTIEAIQVVPAPMGKKLFALEDVYVWESKSYAGSEESNKLEEQRRKGLAPIPLGPGERSDEEIGINSESRQQSPQDNKSEIQDTSSVKCSCSDKCKGKQTALHQDISTGIDKMKLSNEKTCLSNFKEPPPTTRKCPCKMVKKFVSAPLEEEKLPENKKTCQCPSDPSEFVSKPGSCVCNHCKIKRDQLAIVMGGAPAMPQWDYQLSYGHDGSNEPNLLDVYRSSADGGKSVETLMGPSFPTESSSPDTEGIHRPGFTSEVEPSMLPFGDFCVSTRKPPDLTIPSYAETVATADKWQLNSCTCKPSVAERIEFLTHLLQEGIRPLRDSLRELQLKVRDLELPEFTEKEKNGTGDACTCCPFSSACGNSQSFNAPLSFSYCPPVDCPCLGIYIVPHNDGMNPGNFVTPNSMPSTCVPCYPCSKGPIPEKITKCTECVVHSSSAPPDTVSISSKPSITTDPEDGSVNDTNPNQEVVPPENSEIQSNSEMEDDASKQSDTNPNQEVAPPENPEIQSNPEMEDDASKQSGSEHSQKSATSIKTS